MILRTAVLIGLVGLTLAVPYPQDDTAVEAKSDENANTEQVQSEEKTEVAEQASDATPVDTDDPAADDDDDYDEYGWGMDEWMEPVRKVGQHLSDAVGVAADTINTGIDSFNDFWEGGDEDDYNYYDNEDDQVNAWWDRFKEDDYDEYEEDDYDDDEQFYDAMRFPKPAEGAHAKENIHPPNKQPIQLKKMGNRRNNPYQVEDYFDFVVIAMCCVLLFIMLLGGVSRYNNQQYLKKKYGRNSLESKKLLD